VSHGLAGLPPIWTQMLMAIAVASLLLGNVVAIAQTNLKRMLAYSAIANAGFVLLVSRPGRPWLPGSAQFHHRLCDDHAGGFGLILVLSRSGFEHDEIADFKACQHAIPLLAALMLVVMFSTAGVPPFIGFWAKLWIIRRCSTGGIPGWASFAVVISVVGAFYYLRVVWYMYFEAPEDQFNGSKKTAYASDLS